jgi:tritrans,polycis-undecaprenyl-diphosphate synthase [geranylgeranyl-diphosphate specific]
VLSSLLRLGGVYRLYERYLRRQIAKGGPPNHIGLILDGNRRWANHRAYPRWVGHWFGAENAEAFLEWCHDLDLRAVTLYALSTENLAREPTELGELLRLVEERLRALLDDERLHRYRIHVKALGKVELLPTGIRDLLQRIEAATAGYDSHFLNIALAYGGRAEIVDVVRVLAEKAQRGELAPDAITPSTIEEHLYTSHLPFPDPDLVIRTSGEERLSGFLLWQSAYSELVFLDVYWPDFRKIDLMRAIRTYQRRARRFGR